MAYKRPMSQVSFTLVLRGEAIRDGTIDVRDLAPTLLAVGQLFDAANLVLNGDQSRINVRVRATGDGSFEVDLTAIQSIIDSLVTIFSGSTVTAIVQLKELLLGSTLVGGWALIKLIRKLRGRKPDKVVDLKDGRIQLTIDNETFEIPLKLLRLYQDLAVRTAAERVISEPLANPGINEVEFRENGHVLDLVKKEEREWFFTPDLPDEVIIEDSRRSAFSIISLAFKEENKWRLYDGNTQINALIEDQDFLRRVDANQIAFSKGDILVCQVKVRQVRTTDGLKTDYIVERVLEHRPAARQLDLPIESPPTLPRPPSKRIVRGGRRPRKPRRPKA